MKKEYQNPMACAVLFDAQDVLTTSGIHALQFQDRNSGVGAGDRDSWGDLN